MSIVAIIMTMDIATMDTYNLFSVFDVVGDQMQGVYLVQNLYIVAHKIILWFRYVAPI